MRAKTRRLFFYFLALVFVFLGGAITLYSQGYRWNRDGATLETVGGIFVRSKPIDANIFLNGTQIKNKSWFLQSGTLMNSLEPGNYTLEITADGYRPWKKTLPVKPSMVTEADSVVLVKNIPPEPLQFDSSVSRFWFDNGKIAYQKINGRLMIDGLPYSGDIFIDSASDGQFVISENSKTGTYFLTTNDKDRAALNINLLLNNLKARTLNLPGASKIKFAAFYPNDNRKLVIGTDGAVYIMDKDRLALSRIDDYGPAAWTVSGGDLIWQNKNSEVWYYDFTTKAKKMIFTDENLASEIKPVDSSEWSFAMLYPDGKLALAGIFRGDREIIADQASFFSVSTDRQKIALADKDGKINVKYFTKPEKNISFYLPDHGEIESFLWHKDSMHLILKYRDGRIFFVSLDRFLPVSSEPIEQNAKDYFYDSQEDSLYLLKEDGNISTFSFK